MTTIWYNTDIIGKIYLIDFNRTCDNTDIDEYEKKKKREAVANLTDLAKFAFSLFW